MKITNHYCDRCGKKVKSNTLLEVSLSLYGFFSPEGIYSDLCKECSKDFKKWLSIKKEQSK